MTFLRRIRDGLTRRIEFSYSKRGTGVDPVAQWPDEDQVVRLKNCALGIKDLMGEFSKRRLLEINLFVRMLVTGKVPVVLLKYAKLVTREIGDECYQTTRP